MAFELVIFDCDGVLVDSEPIAARVLSGCLAELGLSMTPEQVYGEFVGRSMAGNLERLRVLLARPVPAGFEADFRRRVKLAMADELQPVAHIETTLDAIDLPTCVASSGDHDKMHTTLGITGLLPRFAGRLFSVTQVARSKPHPDVYLYAAGQMGAHPAHCAVVEDTAVGARGGRAAGMTVFGYSALTAPESLTAAGAIVFDDMRALPALLANPPTTGADRA